MKKLPILLILIATIAAFFIFDLGQYFNLEFIKANQAKFNQQYSDSPLLTAAIFFAIYVLVTGFSLPGATIMTLAGGALFGLTTGLIIISFASSIGATLAFLFSRF